MAVIQTTVLDGDDGVGCGMTKQLPKLMTSGEAAEYLGISLRTLHRIRIAGSIGYIVVADRTYRYTENHIRQYLKRNYGGPPPERFEGQKPLYVNPPLFDANGNPRLEGEPIFHAPSSRSEPRGRPKVNPTPAPPPAPTSPTAESLQDYLQRRLQREAAKLTGAGAKITSGAPRKSRKTKGR